MNIFVLDKNPIIAAQMQCDIHSSKMVLETAQMLASVCHRYEVPHEKMREYGLTTKSGSVYKEAHKNHPCTIWAGNSLANFEWLCRHGKALADTFEYRYNKVHASKQVIDGAYRLIINGIIPFTEAKSTPFALAMPDEYRPNHIPLRETRYGRFHNKGETHASGDEAVQAYRNYYYNGKKEIAKWNKGVSMPDWFAACVVADDGFKSTSKVEVI